MDIRIYGERKREERKVEESEERSGEEWSVGSMGAGTGAGTGVTRVPCSPCVHVCTGVTG